MGLPDSNEIAGHEAQVRSLCGHLDATVWVGDRLYSVSLSSGHEVVGDIDAFQALVEQLRFTDRVNPSALGPDAPGTRRFKSDRHGYTIRVPEGWKVSKERRTDVYTEPVEVPRRFTVTARSLGGKFVDYAWLAKYVLDPSAVNGTLCRSADGTARPILSYMRASRAWAEAEVAGRPARLRGLCGQVQAVIQVGDTAYLLTSFRRDTDRAAFRAIADTFRVAP
jgi:hypothetical protein